jgi:hypothetical protein
MYRDQSRKRSEAGRTEKTASAGEQMAHKMNGKKARSGFSQETWEGGSQKTKGRACDQTKCDCRRCVLRMMSRTGAARGHLSAAAHEQGVRGTRVP